MYRMISQSIFGVGLLLLGIVLASPSVFAQAQAQRSMQTGQHHRMHWDQEAEETFGLGRGMGHQLMTEEEWQEHHQRMSQMTAQEREQYRNEWHAKMQARAKKRGLTMPDSPGPHGRGPGGPSGMGHGHGMGQGQR